MQEGRSGGQAEAPALMGQQGFILIAAVALLATLLGVVLLCLYPLAWEARHAPRHREALRRVKTAEQGIFGRLADQPGGQYSACGGYVSDVGPKMIVAELAAQDDAGAAMQLEYLSEFWYFRRSGSLPVLNQLTSTSFSINQSPAGGTMYGLEDIYRYDLQNGFWVGYRGKSYVKGAIGEEHMRKDYGASSEEVPSWPRFTDGFMGYVEIAGWYSASQFYLYTRPYLYDPYKWDFRLLEHRRYYNPVEKLVVRLYDRREVTTQLSARLIYAQQPDPETVADVMQRLPRLPSKVVVESPSQTSRSGSVTTFVFLWEFVPNPNNPDLVSTGAGRDHTFEIGLKKLVLLEDDVPVFACGITIPPVRDYQCLPKTGHYPTICTQPYYDQYVVEVDYDG
jgi:hypothetical protein